MKSPNHIAIVMDGNGRWGVKNHNSRLIGHQYGLKNIRNIVRYCLKNKIKNLTLFALSSDNLKKRENKEINNLFSLLDDYLKKNIYFFIREKICIKFIGESKNLPSKILSTLKEFSHKTNKPKRNLSINIAFNYSSKKEIIESCKKIIKYKKKINQKNICKYLYTAPIRDPEILIRTGGFSRLSDFLLWQCSYSEIFFLKKLWPDFKSKDLSLIIKKFYRIKRKFGS